MSDLFAPVTGEIVERNEEVVAAPELVNDDPYGEGWLVLIRPDDPAELDGLLDAPAYEEYVESLEADGLKPQSLNRHSRLAGHTRGHTLTLFSVFPRLRVHMRCPTCEHLNEVQCELLFALRLTDGHRSRPRRRRRSRRSRSRPKRRRTSKSSNRDRRA